MALAIGPDSDAVMKTSVHEDKHPSSDRHHPTVSAEATRFRFSPAGGRRPKHPLDIHGRAHPRGTTKTARPYPKGRRAQELPTSGSTLLTPGHALGLRLPQKRKSRRSAGSGGHPCACARETRKPRLSLRFPGSLPFRYAARQFLAGLFQDPPR